MKMKPIEQLPINPIEHKIMLLLGLRGIKRKNLDFRTNSENERFFSYGHWQPIKGEDVLYVQEYCDIEVSEISWRDEDCGWQCYYRIDS